VRIPGLKTLKLSARWLRNRFVGGALILGYHRVAEPAGEAHSLSVTPQHFVEQLEVLVKYGNVISLRELANSLQEKRVPKRAVVLTFDDGYADILYHAKPLLERRQTPATVFVVTGSLGREFWWDKLERILLSSTRFPEQLSLRVSDSGYEWVSKDPNQQPEPGSWQDSIGSIYRALLLVSSVEREKAMEELSAWTGIAPEDRPSRRALSAEELIELAAGDLIDIGAHSVTHPVLAALSIPAQRAEIQESKAHLEKILGQSVTSFSYPNGSSSRATLAIVRESGFGCACASYSDVVWHGTDRFYLPRFWVSDWDGEAFLRWLRFWL
jgi:peptidoglycan/xylan/chitin deacetylase (PgdA/CDA1 family)